ncbi:type II toxin-antitoxin system HicA family toxin [Sphingomonas bacterium]|uniref:type II toxin-antitoxin system HicA family toxin n=1 Tax=Sphingomonas bacterium TaxID=1895847 RepID=UPI001576CF47|nr:type II toxin-antitoxin system HicA family toxin [Sphingomonas bacterium]
MARSDKLFAAMKTSPRGDWTIADIQSLCRDFGITCKAPTRGSHYTLSHPEIGGHLTIPARRPIKPIYIRLLIGMIEGLPRP